MSSMIQAAVNGDRTRQDYAAVPISIEELVRDAVACRDAGAGAIHMHPHDLAGTERMDADLVNEAAARVRDACGLPVGVTTGEWIEPDVDRRITMIRNWRVPDFASVNLCEIGSLRIMQAMIETGIGIEAGVWTAEDAELLGQSGLGNQVTRVLVEPGEIQVGNDGAAALDLVGAIHAVLDQYEITVPRLQHADGAVTWIVLEDALRRGIETRVGLEDTLQLPDGRITSGNPELVRTAIILRDSLPV
jgi:uncharacterized protein (DUF849 family)